MKQFSRPTLLVFPVFRMKSGSVLVQTSCGKARRETRLNYRTILMLNVRLFNNIPDGLVVMISACHCDKRGRPGFDSPSRSFLVLLFLVFFNLVLFSPYSLFRCCLSCSFVLRVSSYSSSLRFYFFFFSENDFAYPCCRDLRAKRILTLYLQPYMF